MSNHIFLARAATPLHNHILPISVKSLDLVGFEIVESSWLIDTTKTVAGADDTNAGNATELK